MTVSWIERRRVCLAYSPGGHKAELDRALEGIALSNCYHVTFKSGRESPPQDIQTYYLCHPRRAIGRSLLNVLQSLWVLLKERPAIVISTGADVATATLILGKLLGAKVVFIETGGTIEPSLTGRLVYRFSDLFVVQWPEKKRRFPKALLASDLLL